MNCVSLLANIQLKFDHDCEKCHKSMKEIAKEFPPKIIEFLQTTIHNEDVTTTLITFIEKEAFNMFPDLLDENHVSMVKKFLDDLVIALFNKINPNHFVQDEAEIEEVCELLNVEEILFEGLQEYF